LSSPPQEPPLPDIHCQKVRRGDAGISTTRKSRKLRSISRKLSSRRGTWNERRGPARRDDPFSNYCHNMRFQIKTIQEKQTHRYLFSFPVWRYPRAASTVAIWSSVPQLNNCVALWEWRNKHYVNKLDGSNASEDMFSTQQLTEEGKHSAVAERS